MHTVKKRVKFACPKFDTLLCVNSYRFDTVSVPVHTKACKQYVPKWHTSARPGEAPRPWPDQSF